MGFVMHVVMCSMAFRSLVNNTYLPYGVNSRKSDWQAAHSLLLLNNLSCGPSLLAYSPVHSSSPVCRYGKVGRFTVFSQSPILTCM